MHVINGINMLNVIDERYYTPEELSKGFKLSLSTIYNLIYKGELPYIKIGKSYRIPHRYLLEYLNNHSSGLTSSPKKLPAAAKEFLNMIIASNVKQSIADVVLFGSYARGNFHADSDIDVLVILKKDDIKIKDQINAISDDAMEAEGYEDLLSVIIMTESQWEQAKKLSTPFYNSIINEGISIWKK